MPDEEPVVWPDDPVEGEPPADEAEAQKSADPPWTATFEDAIKGSRRRQEPAVAAAANEYPTQPSMPAIPALAQLAVTAPEVAETAPPEPSKTEEPAPVADAGDEMPTSTFKTPLPEAATILAANGAEAPIAEASPAEPAPLEHAALSVEEQAASPEPEAATALEAEPAPAPEPQPEPGSQPEAKPELEPEPEAAKADAVEVAQAPAPEPARAMEPEPAPAEEPWVPQPVNPPVPGWAPNFAAAAPAAEHKVDWPGSNLPSWAPMAAGRGTASMPAATRISSTPEPSGSQPPKPAAAPAPAPPQAAPAAAASTPPGVATPARPAEPAKAKSSSWEIVQQKPNEQARAAYMGPSAEDKSYAEWFAWAKRSGAPATACHAAAQGAFRALAAGHDMNTAVQWATLAMASPPGLVSASRQLYCAWYSLGNIDLKLPSPQAHSFSTGAIAALEGGADAPTAHQAGLAAAGIIG